MRSADALLAIKDEIVNDPAGLGYNKKEPGTQAILMSAQRDSGMVIYRSLTTKEVIDILTSSKVGKIQDSALNDQDPNHDLCVTMEKYFSVDALDVSPGTEGIKVVSALASSGLLVQADVDNLVAAASSKAQFSRSDVLGLGFISQGDVEDALK